MAVNWTQEQLEAIEARGSNILVAAAAGSGKTAVLVERIIRRICDATHPVSVDKLLVLTFTEAAASEMKRKITKAIYEKLQKEPENRHLREQNLLVHSAHISTIHAFCKTMIQNNIHATEIPTDFSLIDPTENEILRNQALDAVLESYYSRIKTKQAFRDFAIGYGGIKSDDNLRSTVLSLHNFVRSMAYPTRWMHQATRQYLEVCEKGSFSETVWERRLQALCSQLADEAWQGYRILQRIVREQVPTDLPIYTYFDELPDKFALAYQKVLDGNGTIADIREAQTAFQKGRAVGMNKLDERTASQIDAVRKKMINPPLEEIKELLATVTEEKVAQMIACAPRIKVLVQLVRQSERLHQRMKKERSVLDFNDLEHELLKLLAQKDGTPTPIAQKLRSRFEEILVDEYQDTNDIQDTIFRMLSRDETNVFMVGDLKQCIYQFRNANPKIFAQKYHRYLRGEGGRCIRLFQNFRSRSEVIDCVNGIFASLMTEQLGGISYTSEEYLIRGAKYPNCKSDFKPELLITDTNEANYSPDSEYTQRSSFELEAITVARRIRSLIDQKELEITDKETGELRPLRLGDITILMQTTTHVAELSKTLEEYGIPVSDTVGRKYLDSLEVMTVLNFLRIIDNPMQDIPLLAVLRSGIFGFSADELAQIRLCSDGGFYTALCVAAEQGNDRAKDFLTVLNALREESSQLGADELVWKICHDLHYTELVGCMPEGALRQENLNLLYEHALVYEDGVMHGLFGFLEYVAMLRAGNGDFVAAKSFAAEENTVSVSTIHKSKGLEYPVVILFGLQQYFQETDATKPIIWDEQSGIAMEWVDTVNRVRYFGLPKKLTAQHIVSEQRSEEMRLLYVALTRAKEKLILSCTTGKMRNQWKTAVYDADGRPEEAFVRRLTSMKDWVLTALMPHPEAKGLREFAERPDVLPKLSMEFPLAVRMVNHESNPLALLSQTKETVSSEEKVAVPLSEPLAERIGYVYPYEALGQIPNKLSVSELKRRQMPEEYTPQMLQSPIEMVTEPSEISAAEQGTVVHFALQHIEIAKTDSPAQIAEQLDALVENKTISQAQREVISAEQLYRFFEHPLGKRLKQADEVHREFDFYMKVPAAEVMSNLSEQDGKEEVILQGIADCFFYENGKTVLIDYKTDRVTEERAAERAERYRVQMAYYERGLNAVLPQPITEKYLYFLHCNHAVAM